MDIEIRELELDLTVRDKLIKELKEENKSLKKEIDELKNKKEDSND